MSPTTFQLQRDKLLESWQYIASDDFPSYAHWESITPTSNELREVDHSPASLVIVGQVVSDKLLVSPLGNFQAQEEKQQRYQDSEPSAAKLIVVIRRPVSQIWNDDYALATSRLNSLQEKVAKANGPRQHLLDNDRDSPFVRLGFPLWEKKKYTKKREKYLGDRIEESEDDLIRALREEDDYKIKQDTEYRSFVPSSCLDAFSACTTTHHICLAPVFLPNGKAVPIDELPMRLDNAVIEVMFTLKHFYYAAPSGEVKFRKNQGKESNTFTGTIEQIKILQVDPIIPSPRRELKMKSIQRSPTKDKDNTSSGSKRRSDSVLADTSAPKSKRLRIEGSSSSSTIDEGNSPAPNDTNCDGDEDATT